MGRTQIFPSMDLRDSEEEEERTLPTHRDRNQKKRVQKAAIEREGRFMEGRPGQNSGGSLGITVTGK